VTTLIFRSGSDRTEWWRSQFREKAPDVEIRLWEEPGDVEDIEYALVWNPEPGILKGFPNLKAIFSLGAGVDHLFVDPDLPTEVAITRVVDDSLTERMSEFITLYALRFHRRFERYDEQQREALWRKLPHPGIASRTVGIMGMGVLGQDAAEKLRHVGFDVAGWSRTERSLKGIACFHGPGGLAPFLAGTDILVCLLPLTPLTEGILDATVLAGLPEGAHLINVARGEHVIDADLIAALDSGHIAGALLDVFRGEPLAEEHPFWRHPKITLTPHMASLSDPRTVIEQVVENLRRGQDGRPLLYQVDPERGY
jgi:glyoxylate/hydroxypyruvate reductase A